MKKSLKNFNNSLSILNLSILGYLNFLLSNLLLVGSNGISTILFNKPIPTQHGFNLAEYNAGYTFGVFIYLIELIMTLVIYKYENKKSNFSTNSQSNTMLKLIFLYIGLLFFMIEFLFATIVQIIYITKFMRF